MEALTAIWKQVLPNSGAIQPEANFFQIGGTPEAADRLFVSIAEKFGRRLPSATLYHAPTILRLASLLELPELPHFSPIIPIRPGSQSHPVFMIHGLAGSVQFFRLCEHIQTGRATYGVQARGVDGLQEPFDRVEDMAALYLSALQRDYSGAAIALIGYSFGGLIALEMAHRMVLAGQPPPALIMIDAYPHPRFMPAKARLHLSLKRGKRHIAEMKKLAPSQSISYLVRGFQRRLQRRGKRAANIPSSGNPVSLENTMARVKEKAYIALANYRPPRYRGKVLFVKAASDDYFPSDPVAAWGNTLDDLVIETAVGSHLDLVTSDFEGLAYALTRCLQRS